MQIKLLVIRTANPELLAKFYGILGLTFEYHKHGNSPYHYSGLIRETVLEIYPLTKTQHEADKTLRLGIAIDNFDEIIRLLKEQDIPFIAEPAQTDFGFLAIVEDPDGRKIELYKQ